MVDRYYSLNVKPWSARTLYVYAHADLAQEYSVGLQEIFVSRLCSHIQTNFLQLLTFPASSARVLAYPFHSRWKKRILRSPLRAWKLNIYLPLSLSLYIHSIPSGISRNTSWLEPFHVYNNYGIKPHVGGQDLIPAVCSCLIIISSQSHLRRCFQFDSTKQRKFSPCTLVSSCNNSWANSPFCNDRTVIVNFRSLFNARVLSSLRTCQLRFQVWKLGVNFATKFASSLIQCLNFVCKQMFILNNNNQFNEIQTFYW
jgi:hypothetical protein